MVLISIFTIFCALDIYKISTSLLIFVASWCLSSKQRYQKRRAEDKNHWYKPWGGIRLIVEISYQILILLLLIRSYLHLYDWIINQNVERTGKKNPEIFPWFFPVRRIRTFLREQNLLSYTGLLNDHQFIEV